MIAEFWFWNNKFRVAGVLLGVAFHVAMFAWAMSETNAQAGGYRWLFTWYMPSIVLGLPWSLPALFGDLLIPGGSVLGLALAVCLNGYLLGWPLDAVANHARRNRRKQMIDAYLNATPNDPLVN